MKWFHYLKFKVPFYITILVFFAVLGTGLISLNRTQEEAKNLALEKNLLIAEIIANQIDLYFEYTKKTLVDAADYLYHNPGREVMEEKLVDLYENSHYFDGLFYMTPQGRVTFSVPLNENLYNKTYTHRTYFKNVMEKKKPTIGNVIMSDLLGEAHLNAAAPVLDTNTNEVLGIIGTGIPFNNIRDIANNSQENFQGKIWIVDANGLIVVHPDKELIWTLTPLGDVDMYINNNNYTLNELIQKKEKGTGEYKLDGKTIYASMSFTDNLSFLVMVEQYEDSVLRELNKQKQEIVSVILLFLGFSTFVGLIITYFITKPVNILTKGVRDIEKSVLNAPQIVINSNDELSILADAFNNMSLSLKNKMIELQESYDRVEQMKTYLLNVLSSAPSGILLVDDKEEIIYYNRMIEVITKYCADEIIGKNTDHFFKLLSLRFTSNIESALELTANMEREATIICKDRSQKYVAIICSDIITDEKQQKGRLYFIKDLTALKALEEELSRDNRLRIMGELTSSLIHEIGNPLAGLNNLLEVVQSDLQEEGIHNEMLDTIKEEVIRLNNLIINSIDFTHYSSPRKFTTDIKDLIDGVLQLLNSEFIYKEITVNREYEQDLPLINLDKNKFKQVIINILKNAINAVDAKGIIDISVKTIEANNLYKDNSLKQKYMQIIIRDNGQGIPHEEFSHIFEPFYSAKSEGTGLGLTIAHKIIKEHNGFISVESELSKYTEFKIIVPY